MMLKQDLLAHRGLTLPKRVLRRLNEVGIFAQAHVSLEHQHLARRYVVRGIESGGAVNEVGRYVTFCGPTGGPLPFLHPIDSIGVNGVHAVVIAPILVRVELFRAARTCHLLITRHEPGEVEDGRRPPLENKVLFRGVDGFLDAEQDHKGTDLSDAAMPRFWSRAGEEREIPVLFAPAVRAATLGSNCCGCSHTHFSVAPVTTAATADVSGK
ncbi:MAG: hypothetical protein ACYDD2_06405 [Candidatus Acidiferrales bacterium]